MLRRVEDADRWRSSSATRSTIGSRGADTVTPRTRPPADDDGDHMLVRTVVRCPGWPVESTSSAARVRLRSRGGEVEAHRRRRRHQPTPPRAGRRCAPADEPRAADRGNRVRGRHTPRRRACVLRPLVGGGASPARERRRRREDGHDDAVLAGLARAGAFPDHRFTDADPAIALDDQRAGLRARGARSPSDHILAGTGR